MKPITLHPLSVLAGLALAGLTVLLTGAAQGSLSTKPILTPGVQLVGEIPAEWWTYVELGTAADGTPVQSYTVPLGRHFVVTKAEVLSSAVRADGQQVTAELRAVGHAANFGNGTRVPLPPGALLTVDYNPFLGSTANLWGYLEPVR